MEDTIDALKNKDGLLFCPHCGGLEALEFHGTSRGDVILCPCGAAMTKMASDEWRGLTLRDKWNTRAD